MTDIAREATNAIGSTIDSLKSDAEALATDTTTEAAKVRAELTAKIETIAADLRGDYERVVAAISKPHGEMIFGIAIFVMGIVTGHFVL